MVLVSSVNIYYNYLALNFSVKQTNSMSKHIHFLLDNVVSKRFIKVNSHGPMEMDNLCTLKNLTEGTLLDTLQERYENGQIYTSAGLLLLSLNPYVLVDLHSPAVADLCRRNTPDLRLHIYALLDACKMDEGAYGQHSVIVSGESGSGKTEEVRHMLEYMNIPLISSVDIIIECLGNARTINNDNSSRFGRLVKIRDVISIETFLLERCRVTNSSKEYNFQIFYILLKHINDHLVNDYINMKSFLETGNYPRKCEIRGS